MSFLDYLLGSRKKSASIAKERLQIILAHEHDGRTGAPDYLPIMKQEILNVIAKYVAVDQDKINVKLDRDDHFEVLELNIVLQELPKK